MRVGRCVPGFGAGVVLWWRENSVLTVVPGEVHAVVQTSLFFGEFAEILPSLGDPDGD